MSANLEKWEVWALDVWGNEEDGYTVNDRRRAGSILLPENATDERIFRAMSESGYMMRPEMKIDGDDGLFHIMSRYDEPVYMVEKSE